MRENWSVTLTRIIYRPEVKDEIIHNIGMDNEYKLQENIVGLDEYIKNSKDKEYLEAIINTKEIQKIDMVYQWINGTDAYIWRLNNKLNVDVIKVVRFDASSDGAGLDCDGDPLGSVSAIGVRVREK